MRPRLQVTLCIPRSYRLAGAINDADDVLPERCQVRSLRTTMPAAAVVIAVASVAGVDCQGDWRG